MTCSANDRLPGIFYSFYMFLAGQWVGASTEAVYITTNHVPVFQEADQSLSVA